MQNSRDIIITAVKYVNRKDTQTLSFLEGIMGDVISLLYCGFKRPFQ